MNPNSYNLFCVAAYLGLILLIGYAALCVILKPGIRHWAALAGLCVGTGVGVLSFILFAASIAGVKPNRFTLVGTATVALAVLIYLWRQKHLLRASVPSPRGKMHVFTPLGVVGLGLIFAAIANVAVRAGWPGLNDTDVFAIWLFKAKSIATFPLRPMPAAFLDPTLSYSHQDYPLSLPFVAAGLYAVVGRIDEPAAALLCLPIYLGLLLIIYAAVRQMHRRAVALCITAIFSAAPVLCQNAGLLVAETWLLLALAGATTMLLRWIELGEAGDLVVSGLCVAIAAFTKNEGLALLPMFGIAALMLAAFRNKLKEWFVAAVVCAVMIGPWLVYRTQLPKTHEDYGGKLTQASMVAHNLNRLGYIAPQFFGRMFDGPRAGLIWYVLLIVALLGVRGFQRSSVRILWCLLLIQLLLYLATFVVTPWDIAVLLPMITPKLLTQASVIATLLIALHLREMRWLLPDKSRV